MTLKTVQRNEVQPPTQEAVAAVSASDVMLEPVSRMFCPVCKQKMNTSSAKALSEGCCPSCGENVFVYGRIGAYRVLRVLGQGGMGVVYEGFDEGLGRKVAIKVTQVDVTQDKEMLATFQREAQIVAKLNHPNVVQVYAFGEEKGHPYLVMELLPAGSLLDRISGEESVDPVFLMGVALEVSEGLNAAQEAGLLHGDIKPENILFDDKMHAKLVDFGLAAISGSATKNVVWGTPYYIAPEKVTERKSNHKCDIYSFGATLYHALARRPPFDGLDGTAVIKAAIEEQAAPVSTLCPNVPPAVEAIVSRMMEKDVLRRYPNYKSIIADIKRFLSTIPREQLTRPSRLVNHGSRKTAGTRKIRVTGAVLPPAAVSSLYSVVPAEEKPPKSSRKGLVIAGAVLAGVAILGGVGYGLMKGSEKTQQLLFSQAQKTEEHYFKAYTCIRDAYLKIEKIEGEAQQLLGVVQAQEGRISKGGSTLAEKSKTIQADGEKVRALFHDVEVFRNHAEQSKPEPLTKALVDKEQLVKLQQEVRARMKDGETIKVKVEAAEKLFSGMKSKWASIETEIKKSVGNVQKPPSENKELAKGFGNHGASVDLTKQERLRDFLLNAGESVILAVWKSSSTEDGGGSVKNLKIVRKEGETADFTGVPSDTALGTFFLKGLQRQDQSLVIRRTIDALPGQESGYFVLPSVQGITFFSMSDSDLFLALSGQTNSDAPLGWTPAILFTAKKSGRYSMSGTIALGAVTSPTTVKWMVWTARLK